VWVCNFTLPKIDPCRYPANCTSSKTVRTIAYLAGAVFLLGSLAWFERDQFTWKAHASQMLNNKNMRWASNLFHVGILLFWNAPVTYVARPYQVVRQR
jgi:nitrate reductase gamma subunit